MGFFIPKKIKVGYQNRDDTYTKKLAYVIYYDEKGKLRKETSWKGWCDAKIPAEDFDNVPTSGFVLNKGVRRYGYSWNSSGRSMIRIYDPRGIEFEITVQNLIAILMNSNCNKRGLDGEYVYAWDAGELVLLPTCSEDYVEAIAYSSRLDQKVSAKELIPGASYKTKRDGDVIYLGRFDWYDFKGSKYSLRGAREGKKQHIFTIKGDSFQPKSSVGFLASANTTEPVTNYAELMDKFNSCQHSSRYVNFEIKPIKYTLEDLSKSNYEWERRTTKSGYRIKNGKLINCSINTYFDVKYLDPNDFNKISKEFGSHSLQEWCIFDLKKQEFFQEKRHSYWSTPQSNYTERQNISLEEINSFNIGELWVTLENGKKVQIASSYDL